MPGSGNFVNGMRVNGQNGEPSGLYTLPWLGGRHERGSSRSPGLQRGVPDLGGQEQEDLNARATDLEAG